ncbi:erythroblast NAD(P)(+)--arginine ADP-ribosyltransferase-like [Misgurnus anguillicaudatus]|uniref:erythroblast NAD(P)(+)--arginine ADP-ribosyltransferase-like n=1 Tax=Misgurnus anguillicaudatus TaxID=75329 RepID=UPI003CCF6996
MAENSIDDRYDGCTERMANLVSSRFLHIEWLCTEGFYKAWVDAEKQINGSKDNLTVNHLTAILVYTQPLVADIHIKFNNDVMTGKQKYRADTYKWYSLHFLLTDAIQILKKTQNNCTTTYRGTHDMFNENVLYKEIRFGRFTSSSLLRSEAVWFGSESCFEIQTCHGANITKYSSKPNEKEVLIPPYEKFNVTAIRKRGEKYEWCKTVFVLNSTGIRSDLNCAVASIESQKCPRRSPLRHTPYYNPANYRPLGTRPGRIQPARKFYNKNMRCKRKYFPQYLRRNKGWSGTRFLGTP